MLIEKQIINAFKTGMLVRHDPDGAVRYFSPEDFPEIIVERGSHPKGIFLQERGHERG